MNDKKIYFTQIVFYLEDIIKEIFIDYIEEDSEFISIDFSKVDRNYWFCKLILKSRNIKQKFLKKINEFRKNFKLLSLKSINDNVSIVNEPEAPQVAPPGRSDLTEITSPMVGTFYRAAAPGEEPFVEVGNNIKVGQTICILEAMKLMNEIESEFNAEIVEILVENGTPVEFGQVLMRVKQS